MKGIQARRFPRPWLISLTHDLPSSLVLSLPLKNRYLAAFPSTPRLPSPRCSPSRAIPSIPQIPNLLGFRYMLMRVVAVILLLSAGLAAEAASYSFVCKASGRLGGPIRFEFYRDSTTRPKTDIESFTVSMRTADDRWKAMWSILSGRGLTQPIEYGVTPPGFTTMIQPQKLIPGRVYAGFASDGHGGTSGVTFGFDKNGRMTFPDSFDR